jgi:hypothetical protein
MRIAKLCLTLLGLCCSLSACQNSGTNGNQTNNHTSPNKMPDKFDWNPGASAPGFYPMEYYDIQFVFADGTKQGMPNTTVGQGNNAWGSNQASVVVGADKKAIPVKLNITWLSYTENQFYTGSFDLPYDKMFDLFKKGWPEFDYGTNKPGTSTFNTITAGMAPGGLVVVWLSAAAHQVEVASFKANKTVVRMNEFAPASYTHNQTQYVNDVLKEPEQAKYLKEHGVPVNKWANYRQRYQSRPVVSYDEGFDAKTEKMVLSYYNGEIETFEHRDIEKKAFEPRAKVKVFYFYWVVQPAGKSEGYELEIKLDEDEVNKAYADIFGKEGKGQGEFFVEVNKAHDNYLVVLQNQNKRVQLHKLEGAIYPVKKQ